MSGHICSGSHVDADPFENVNFDELDPGIRETVRWLLSMGFATTDSGDGRSKREDIANGRALDEAHVFMRCAPDNLVLESRRLRGLLDVRALAFSGRIEASYSPDDDVAFIMLFGVDDAAMESR